MYIYTRYRYTLMSKENLDITVYSASLIDNYGAWKSIYNALTV